MNKKRIEKLIKDNSYHIEEYLEAIDSPAVDDLPMPMIDFLGWCYESDIDYHDIVARGFNKRHAYAVLTNTGVDGWGSDEWISLTDTNYKQYLINCIDDKLDYINWLVESGYIKNKG